MRIEVEDDGVGMSEDVRLKVFESFFTTKLGKGGSGIGLTFSKRLIEETLGGTIAVESTPNVGSRFVLDLPLVAPTEPVQTKTAPSAVADEIRISEDSFSGSVFRPHGRYSAKCEGRLVIMEASGPFNAEMLQAYHQATLPLLAKVRARGPYVTLTEYHDSMMMSPSVVDLLAKSVAQANIEGNSALAVAYAVEPSVEGRDLMIPLIESTVFAPVGHQFKAFSNRTDAEAWLRSVLAAAGSA